MDIIAPERNIYARQFINHAVGAERSGCERSFACPCPELFDSSIFVKFKRNNKLWLEFPLKSVGNQSRIAAETAYCRGSVLVWYKLGTTACAMIDLHLRLVTGIIRTAGIIITACLRIACLRITVLCQILIYRTWFLTWRACQHLCVRIKYHDGTASGTFVSDCFAQNSTPCN